MLHIFSLLLHVKPQGFFWLSLVGRNLPRDTNWKSTVWLGTMIQDMRSDALCGVLKTSKVASWHEMLQAKDKSNPPSGIDLTICRQLLRICQSIPQALLNPKNKDRTQVSRLFPTGVTFLGDTSIWYAGRDQNCTLTKSMVFSITQSQRIMEIQSLTHILQVYIYIYVIRICLCIETSTLQVPIPI